MERRACGNTGLTLPVLGVGVWSFGGGEGDYWGSQDERDATAVADRALALGADYFDTAEMYNYGRSEAALGRVLAGRREQALIGSKLLPASATSPEAVREHCEATLARLQTDTVDIYMVHWPLPAEAVEPTFAILMQLQAENKIRHIGVSNFGVRQMTEVLATGVTLAVNQLPYSLLARGIEREILPFCAAHGIGVIGYMPLIQGLLTGKYRSADEMPPGLTRSRHFRPDRPESRHGEPGAEAETFAAVDGLREIASREGVPMAQLALAWAATNPAVTCVLAGARNVQQLEENAAGVNRQLTAEVIAEMSALSEPVLAKLGTNVDLWQPVERSRTH